MTAKQFTTALRDHRKRTARTQDQQAEFLGISPRKLWGWENVRPPGKLEMTGAVEMIRADPKCAAIDKKQA